MRKVTIGAASAAALSAASASAASADSTGYVTTAEAAATYVPQVGSQAAGTFVPVFTRTPANRPSGSILGFYTGTTVYNGTVDPFVAMGYFGGPTDLSSTLQLEADWDIGQGQHITELYWQIVKPDGTSRRPLYGEYDRVLGRTAQWLFMIGNGVGGQNVTSPVFAVNWDDDSSQSGVGMFAARPNRLDVTAVTTGGIQPDWTKLRMYSAPGHGSAIALSYGGGDPEAWGTAYYLYTVGPTQVNLAVGGGFVGSWVTPSSTQPPLQMVGGVGLGDGGTQRQAIWAARGVPASTMGSDSDWAISDNGHLYFKSAGVWTQKA